MPYPQRLQQLLQDSHLLLERHVSTNNLQTADITQLRHTATSLKAEINEMRTQYDDKVKELEIEKETREEVVRLWKEEVSKRVVSQGKTLVEECVLG